MARLARRRARRAGRALQSDQRGGARASSGRLHTRCACTAHAPSPPPPAAAQLDSYEQKCEQHAGSLVRVADAHATLSRVVVLDARYGWNGVGDNTERYAFLLRAGRALGRAAFVLFDPCALSPGDAAAVPRADPSMYWRRAGAFGRCAFDPGVWVHQLGGASWRWSGAQAAAVRAAQPPGTQPLRLHYACDRPERDAWACTRGSVRRGGSGGAAAFSAEGNATEVAHALWTFLRDDPAVAAHPLLWVSSSVQGDLQVAANLEWMCASGGYPPNPPWGGCGQACDAFAFWRPRPRLWAALAPTLGAMDRWPGGAVGLMARTGAADHLDSLPSAFAPAADGGGGGPPPLAPRLAPLFLPCPDPSALRRFWRNRRPGDGPCATYGDEAAGGAGVAPTPAAAVQCGPDSALAGALAAAAPGPMGLFMACAARAAAALALDRGRPGAWGVLMFSDAPAMKCALEEAAAGAGAGGGGDAWVTPTAPGHIGYAPDTSLLRTGLAALVDTYAMQLVDFVVPLTKSAFANAASLRRMLPERRPPGWDAPGRRAMAPGFERWFEVGREVQWDGGAGGGAGAPATAGRGINRTLLALLAATTPRCPATRASMAAAAREPRVQPAWAEGGGR